MSVDIDILKKHGVSSGEYKKIFTAPIKPRRVQRLIDLISNRIKDGFQRNLADSRIYAAIDLAYDAPFNQITPTLMRHLLSRDLKADEMAEQLKHYGLREEDLFLKVRVGQGAEMKEALIPNPPVFFEVLIPAVRAYCKARIATLFNARNKSPLLPFKPVKKTARNRVACEIWTDVIEKMATKYGYVNTMQAAIFQQIKYGISLSFPVEEWHCEKQLQEVNGEEKEVTVREGIRHRFPHPTRMFYDLYNPLTTLNSNTGISHLGHWSVNPFSDILDNSLYWNRRSIPYGTNWFNSPTAGGYANFFWEFYPCRLTFPIVTAGADALREDKAAFYSSEDRDRAVFLTHVYMEIVPKDWGLGRYEEIKGKLKIQDTYDHPVWHHFIVASDATIIWAEPCAYVPSWGMFYDYDPQAGRQSSLALEAIPWQDTLGNILSQMILTAKQNLANVIFYDINQVDKNDIEKIKNLGEMKYRAMNFLAFDSLKSTRAGTDPNKAFQQVKFDYKSLQDMIQMLSSTLDIMERVLQFTAQEVGATAKHYQSAEEIKETSESSDQSVNYTASSTDIAIDAWKRQLHDAAMAYMDDEIVAEISDDIPDVEQILQELGFKIVGRSKDKITVKGEKHTLGLDEFAKAGGEQEPETDQQTAQAMFNTLAILVKSEPLFQAIGVKKILSIIEQAAKLAGADSDFKLKVDQQAQPPQPGQPTGQPPAGQPPGAPPAGPAPAPQQGKPVPPEFAQLFQQMQAQILQIVEQKVVAPAAKEMATIENQVKQLASLVQKIEGVLAGAGSKPAVPPTAPAPPVPVPPAPAPAGPPVG